MQYLIIFLCIQAGNGSNAAVVNFSEEVLESGKYQVKLVDGIPNFTKKRIAFQLAKETQSLLLDILT